ncbi:hypothetical protein [Microvirga massiliensis]|uniref:hypothetical protein n=1 Tax=Microvirga massiliensis TaxID=1033741 RepID=UPI00062BDC46|nr:hypothetical protein [Microvirga massiliensis]
MTTITPGRDAAQRMLARLDEEIERQVALGAPPHSIEVTRALMRATLTSLGDMIDREADVPEMMAAFEIAFTEAITTMLRTVLAQQAVMTPDAAAPVLLLHILRGVERRLEGEPWGAEAIHYPEIGHA